MMNEEDVTVSNLNQPTIVMSALVAIMLVVSVFAWFYLPEDVSVPVHWGIDGTPDRYAGKLEGLLVVPLSALFVVVLFRLIPLIEPRRRHLLQSSQAFSAVCVSIVTLFTALHLLMIGNLLGMLAIGINSAVMFMVSILFVLIGNYLGKVRSNFLFGIRTPWTLSSELSWNKTHRLTGKLMIASGAITALTVFIVPGLAGKVLLTTVMGSVLIGVVYSFIVWRSDPDKRVD